MSKSRYDSDDFREKVRNCLLRDWDPIGIGEIPEASDEYDSYVGGICSLLLSGADAYKLYHHLTQIEKVDMGLFSSPSEKLHKVVGKLFAIADEHQH